MAKPETFYEATYRYMIEGFDCYTMTPWKYRMTHKYWMTNWETETPCLFQNYNLRLARSASNIYGALFEDGMVAYSDQMHGDLLIRAERRRKPVAGLVTRKILQDDKRNLHDDVDIRGLTNEAVARLARFAINAELHEDAVIFLRLASHPTDAFYYDCPGTSNLWWGHSNKFDFEIIKAIKVE